MKKIGIWRHHFLNIFGILSPYTTPLAILFLHRFVISLECFLIGPEFVTSPGLSVERNAPIVEFRERFVAALEKRERRDTLPEDKSCNGSNEKVAALVNAPPRFIFDIIGTLLWEIVYRCTYSYPWRARTDGASVLGQILGGKRDVEHELNERTDTLTVAMATIVLAEEIQQVISIGLLFTIYQSENKKFLVPFC